MKDNELFAIPLWFTTVGLSYVAGGVWVALAVASALLFFGVAVDAVLKRLRALDKKVVEEW